MSAACTQRANPPPTMGVSSTPYSTPSISCSGRAGEVGRCPKSGKYRETGDDIAEYLGLFAL